MSTQPTTIDSAPRSAEAAASLDADAAASLDADAAEPVLKTVTSRDGTTIGYRQFGGGPGLILVHGSMSSDAHHTELARLLSDTFTVFVPDRRGRGLSGRHGAGDVLQQELEDVAAVLDATRATNLWGLSSGACIALHAARTMPAIAKVGIFEPPLVPDRAADHAASWNSDVRGHPEPVARELRRFFA